MRQTNEAWTLVLALFGIRWIVVFDGDTCLFPFCLSHKFFCGRLELIMIKVGEMGLMIYDNDDDDDGDVDDE